MVDVLIVDDQSLFRSVARAVVGLVGGWRVVGEAGSALSGWLAVAAGAGEQAKQIEADLVPHDAREWAAAPGDPIIGLPWVLSAPRTRQQSCSADVGQPCCRVREQEGWSRAQKI